jgi:DNA primase
MTDFSRNDLDALKAQVDLVALMRSSGVELQTVGRNLKALCPWHEDKDASLVVNPEKGLYNCFGCSAKGDVLSFLQERENLSFPQAVARLRELAGVAPTAPAFTPAKGDPDRFPGGLTRDGLLGKVMAHYQAGLARAPEAREYLESRKLWDVGMVQAFGLGYCDGTLLATLPPTGPIREALTALGVLSAKGKEHFLGCVVAPLHHPSAGLVGLYGRRVSGTAKVRHLFLSGPKRGIFGLGGLGEAQVLTLAEGVFDALSLWLAGVRPVTAIYGTAGLSEDLERFLRASSIRELRLCFDSDRAGEEAVERIVDQVGDRFRLSRVLLPPGSDPNDLLSRESAEILREFAQCQQPVASLAGQDPTDPGDDEIPLTETSDTGFVLEFAEVRYEVTPTPPYGGRLKVSIRAERFKGPEGADHTRKRPKFLDRCDLVSSRSRTETLRGMGQRLLLERDEAERHLRVILDTAEEWVAALSAAGPDSKEVSEMTEAQRSEALAFLNEPGLVHRLQADMEALGHVGEEKGKLLAYLVGISRRLENPLSAIIRSQSGAGKSGMARLVASLVPPEDVIHYSRVSAHALAYAGKDAYKRKLILMEERVGGEAADYYIRILQSSHVIRQAVVIKDPVTGQMKTQEFEVEGPIAYIETTTDAQLNPENASRCFEIFLDESEAQTQRIQERQRAAREAVRLNQTDRQAILEKHHNAQRLLEPVKVVIPYVRHLSFPTRWLRTRRDNERFLCLIEASAFLHQHQRPGGRLARPDGTEVAYVEATLEDYALAYELARDVLRDCLHELSPSARELFEVAKKFEKEFTRRELREASGWPQRRVLETVDELVAMEYLSASSGHQGKTYLYSVAAGNGSHPSPVSALLHPEQLATRLADTG